MKYKNKITEIDGIKFHSKKESKRYQDLKFLLKHNFIRDLECQHSINLVCNSLVIGKYICDFKYYDLQKNKWIIEDVKSPATITPLYKLKKKILLTYDPPIVITEII